MAPSNVTPASIPTGSWTTISPVMDVKVEPASDDVNLTLQFKVPSLSVSSVIFVFSTTESILVTRINVIRTGIP